MHKIQSFPGRFQNALIFTLDGRSQVTVHGKWSIFSRNGSFDILKGHI